jgi:hypothetical protein
MLPKERRHQFNEIQIVEDENIEALKALSKLHIIYNLSANFVSIIQSIANWSSSKKVLIYISVQARRSSNS